MICVDFNVIMVILADGHLTITPDRPIEKEEIQVRCSHALKIKDGTFSWMLNGNKLTAKKGSIAIDGIHGSSSNLKFTKASPYYNGMLTFHDLMNSSCIFIL